MEKIKNFWLDYEKVAGKSLISKLIMIFMISTIIFGILSVFWIYSDVKESEVFYNKWISNLKTNDSAYISPGTASHRWPRGKVISLSGDSAVVIIKTKKENLSPYK